MSYCTPASCRACAARHVPGAPRSNQSSASETVHRRRRPPWIRPNSPASPAYTSCCGKVEQHVGIPLPAAHRGLAAREVRGETSEVLEPPRVLPAVRGSVEQPPRPRDSGGRIRDALEEEPVHAGEEEPVRGPPHRVQPDGEVLAEPGECFGRAHGPGREVRGRGGHLRDGPHQPRPAEGLGLRDVGERVVVHERPGRTVRLQARGHPVRMAPAHPFPERVLEQLGHGPPVVVAQPAAELVVAVEPVEPGREIVAPALPERCEDARRGVCLEDLEGIGEGRGRPQGEPSDASGASKPARNSRTASTEYGSTTGPSPPGPARFTCCPVGTNRATVFPPSRSTTSRHAACSAPTHGPPHGQPLPMVRSTPSPSRSASRSVCSSIRIQAGER